MIISFILLCSFAFSFIKIGTITNDYALIYNIAKKNTEKLINFEKKHNFYYEDKIINYTLQIINNRIYDFINFIYIFNHIAIIIILYPYAFYNSIFYKNPTCYKNLK